MIDYFGMSDNRDTPMLIIDKMTKKENAYRSVTELSKELNF